MSKAVLISIRPEWCQKIMAGRKTIEVRRTRPKMNPPFKCYIYKCGNGKVVGEFLCDQIIEDRTYGHNEEFYRAACMSAYDAAAYAVQSPMYGWHISNLKIYDTPKELIEFHTWKKCKSCNKSGYESTACIYDENCIIPAAITKAPQSWCYVEEEIWND